MAEDLKKVGKLKVIQIQKKPEYRGNYSKVYFGRYAEKEVAVKRVDKDDKVSKELGLLQDFQHENIVQFLFTDVDPEGDFIYIVMEKCHCSLKEFISSKEHEIPHLQILWQIVCGIDYLHSVKHIIHRDLKPHNVLMISQDGHWVVKLADFGISKQLDPSRSKVTQTSIEGTDGYLSPEALRGEKIDFRADIHPLGIVFYYVLSEGDHPFGGGDNLGTLVGIRDGTVKPNLGKLKQKFAHDATSLILTMMAHKREDRLHITEVMAHHLFWDAEKKLLFIQDVSDFCISDANVGMMLEKEQEDLVGHWRKNLYALDPVLKEGFDETHTGERDGMCDLLQNFGNLKSGYDEKSEKFCGIVGTMPDGVVQLFTSRFPKLLSYVYDMLKCHCQGFKIQKYYEPEGRAVCLLDGVFSIPSGRKLMTKTSDDWIPIGLGLIKLGKEIGSAAMVYEGYFGDIHVAVKKVHDTSDQNEVNIVSKLDHENIIKYKYSEVIGEMSFIVFERCLFNLSNYVKTKHAEIPLSRVDVLIQIAEGVTYLHNAKTIHGDLKPSHILFAYNDRDSRWRVKITGFDMSISLDSNTTFYTTRVIEIVKFCYYKAPEVWGAEFQESGCRIGKEIDIFSLGFMFFFILTGGNHPFGSPWRSFFGSTTIFDDDIWNMNFHLSGLLDEYRIYAESLIMSMIENDWKKRLTAAEIRTHYFFWSCQEKLNFIMAVSYFFNDRKSNQELLQKLEEKCQEVGWYWLEKIGGSENPEISRILGSRMKRNDGVQSLLRQIRIWVHNYHSMSEKFRQEVGSLPDGFIQFFESKFPYLLPLRLMS